MTHIWKDNSWKKEITIKKPDFTPGIRMCIDCKEWPVKARSRRSKRCYQCYQKHYRETVRLSVTSSKLRSI